MQLVEHYHALRAVHVGCVGVTFSLFLLRGVWMMRTPERLQARWVRIVPHVNDTLLLASAVALAAAIHQYPFVDAWLTAKLLALLLYIVLGSVALKHGRSLRIRVTAWLGALAVFGYIVAVAVTHSATL